MSEKNEVPKGTWKLPDGIEEHLTSGVLNATIGATIGGLLGLAMFRTGRGWRAATIAAGVGVGTGSTVQRATKMTN